MKLTKSLGLVLALVVGLVMSIAGAGYAETDVTSKVQVIKSALSYDRVAKQSYLNVSVKNISGDVLLTPITVVINSVSPSTVMVVNADGTKTGGEAFFDFKQVVNGSGNEFAPGQTTQIRKIVFNNPYAAKFTYSVSVMGSEAPVSSNTPPSLGMNIGLDLGGERVVPITTQKYVGSIEIPAHFPLASSALFVESGVAGLTSISSQGLFKAEMNSDATTLLAVVDGNGGSYLMKLFPKSNDIREVNPVINAKSTAVALIAMQAGIMTSEPNIDAIILAMINNLQETRQLTDQITTELNLGTFRLNGSSGLSTAVLQKCAAVHAAFASASYANVLAFSVAQKATYNIGRIFDSFVSNAYADDWFNMDCNDEDTGSIHDIDGIDRDGICLSGTIAPAGQDSTFYLKNKLGRWVALGKVTSAGDFEHVDWVEPKNISLPTVSSLVQKILSLGWDETKIFFAGIFTVQVDNSNLGIELINKVKVAVSSYYGLGSSDHVYHFTDPGLYNFSTNGASFHGQNALASNEVFSSTIMSITSEIVGPWISVLMEIKGSDIKSSVKHSIAEPACKQAMVDYYAKATPMLVDVYAKYNDEGIWPAVGQFTNNFFLNSFIKGGSGGVSVGGGNGTIIVGCLLKQIISYQSVRAVIINKIQDYAFSAGMAAWIDMINKGVSIINAGCSTYQFIQMIVDNNFSKVDEYQVKIDLTCSVYNTSGNPLIWNPQYETKWTGQIVQCSRHDDTLGVDVTWYEDGRRFDSGYKVIFIEKNIKTMPPVIVSSTIELNQSNQIIRVIKTSGEDIDSYIFDSHITAKIMGQYADGGLGIFDRESSVQRRAYNGTDITSSNVLLCYPCTYYDDNGNTIYGVMKKFTNYITGYYEETPQPDWNGCPSKQDVYMINDLNLNDSLIWGAGFNYQP